MKELLGTLLKVGEDYNVPVFLFLNSGVLLVGKAWFTAVDQTYIAVRSDGSGVFPNRLWLVDIAAIQSISVGT
jgi:hypothetical protein